MNEVIFILDSCVRGYHVYKDLWNATPGEALTCIREWRNRNDVFAVAAEWQCKAMAILLGIYLSKFRVFVRFLYVEAEY